LDVCVVTYRNGPERIAAAIRPHDTLWVRDNTRDNIGFAAGANQLAAKGEQPLIAFVNPDGDPQPGCFDRLEAIFDDLDVVAAEASQGQESGATPDRPVEASRFDWLAGSCLVVRRTAFELVDGFDADLFMYCEDVDLSRRLAQLGRLEHCWDAVFLHDIGHRRGLRAEYLQARNTLIVDHRYGRASPWMMARGVLSALRRGETRTAIGRVTGLVAYGWMCLLHRT
jgi:GT2 family glycosyltransferase